MRDRGLTRSPRSGSALPASAAAIVLARRPGFTLARFVDAQRTAAHLEAIHMLNGRLGFRSCHLHESKTTRTAGFTVVHELDGLHRPMLFEQAAHFCFGRTERK